MLNGDTKTYGKDFLFDGHDETCWNSDEGPVQWVLIKFDNPVRISQVSPPP